MKRARTFPARVDSVPDARDFAAAALAGVPQDLMNSVVLMVSELATNCVRHGNAPFELLIETDGSTLTISVTDPGEGIPRRRDPAPTDASGRGLLIVERCSDSWGVSTGSGKKRVWFTLSSPALAELDNNQARQTSTLRPLDQSVERHRWEGSLVQLALPTPGF